MCVCVCLPVIWKCKCFKNCCMGCVFVSMRLEAC